MSDFLLTGAVTNAINMASVSAEDAPRLKPYLELCRLMGAFANPRWLSLLAWALFAIITLANIWLVAQAFTG